MERARTESTSLVSASYDEQIYNAATDLMDWEKLHTFRMKHQGAVALKIQVSWLISSQLVDLGFRCKHCRGVEALCSPTSTG
jgi:hypothetical protein